MKPKSFKNGVWTKSGLKNRLLKSTEMTKGTLWFFQYEEYNPPSRFPICCSLCLEMSYSTYCMGLFLSHSTFWFLSKCLLLTRPLTFTSLSLNDALFFLTVFINTKYYSVCLFIYSLPLLLELSEVSTLSLFYFSHLDYCLAHSKWAKCIYLLNK